MKVEPASPPGRFQPLAADHPLVGDASCPVCGQLLQVGDVPAFCNPVPADLDEWDRAAEGLAHNAVVEVAHERCVYP